MRIRALLIASCSLLCAASVAAQSTAAGDPISGRWVEDGTTFLDLKFDGKGAVSGKIAAGRPDNLAPIKTGTFDPRTGVLKLAGDAKKPDDGTIVPFVIEGNVANDTLRVTGTFGSSKGSKTLTRSASSRPAGDDVAAALRKSFTQVSGWVAKAAELVPADKYTYRPTKSVRTFGELIAHVADAYNWYCANASGRNAQWSDAIEKGKTDKVTVVPKLKQALDVCTAAYGGNGKVGVLIENVGHTSLHYGNVITYMRMMGLVPPSS